MPFRTRQGIICQKIDDELVLLDRHREQIHQLNSVASLIWEKLASGTEMDDIIQLLTTRYAVDETTARNDIEQLISDLQQKELIEGVQNEEKA